ncbi:IS66 family insertion sequence element accessory protein TnpB [uncultured Ruegeria sp.]|uniref:IS66 family insertion sequence element accessory protein TnpB n=1 Tax=uncultured Ruegeria sp. TaxID=259304 RepID=UPI00345432A9
MGKNGCRLWIGKFIFYLATMPVEFRIGMDELVSIILNDFDLDPFCIAIFIFRSNDRIGASLSFRTEPAE